MPSPDDLALAEAAATLRFASTIHTGYSVEVEPGFVKEAMLLFARARLSLLRADPSCEARHILLRRSPKRPDDEIYLIRDPAAPPPIPQLEAPHAS